MGESLEELCRLCAAFDPFRRKTEEFDRQNTNLPAIQGKVLNDVSSIRQHDEKGEALSGRKGGKKVPNSSKQVPKERGKT
ncbi:hypothetical protein RUM43_014408 [Polyplax serrata]|uniref:Uncharacterized protein n=1 Tax=Polyplax serrata TaxID=468196 RepID=A0AAN8S6S6_POLSC